jgi:glycosyltransferase involved in cell wall biosynthesis
VAEGFGPGVQALSIDAHNVGAARAAGFNRARTVWPDANLARTWYATTDADSRVDPDWLVRQMVADADMVLGVVRAQPGDMSRRGSRAGTYTATDPNLEAIGQAITTSTARTWVFLPRSIGR